MLATRKTFADLIEGFVDQPRLIVDTETNGVKPWLGDRVIGVSMATPALDHIVYFPTRHQQGKNLRWSQYQRLISLLSQPDVVYTGWNYKFDLEFLMQDGMTFPHRIEDIMLACHHLNENDKPFELKRWCVKYADPTAKLAEDELAQKVRAEMKRLGIKVGKGAKKDAWKGYMEILHPREVSPYACDDVRSTEKLRRMALPELQQWDTPEAREAGFQSPYRLWRQSNRYLLTVAKMELRGFQLDVPRLKKLARQSKRYEEKAYAVLTEKAGYEINPNSPKQVCAFLKISSSAKDILEEINTPECEALLSYRAWNKARTTYYERWLEWMDVDSVLHPNLNLHRVVTGRQSASDPNMHGVPRYRKEYKVKDVIVSRPGYVLLSADYNQAELRVGVSVAQEENMAKLFRSKPLPGKKTVDIHQLVADALHIERDPAKTINFMILYGGGEEKLARKLGISLIAAREYLRHYHAEYWHFKHTSRFWANRARYQRYIRLWTGRLRHFNHPLANPKDAFNSLVQGGVAEMLRVAIGRLDRIMPSYDVHMLLQIHDQIIFECPTGVEHEVIPIITRKMEHFPHWMIPPVVDLKIGDRWGQLQDYEPPKARKAA